MNKDRQILPCIGTIASTITIDEFQDTSRSQYDFFSADGGLGSNDGNTFFAVGDPMHRFTASVMPMSRFSAGAGNTASLTLF